MLTSSAPLGLASPANPPEQRAPWESASGPQAAPASEPVVELTVEPAAKQAKQEKQERHSHRAAKHGKPGRRKRGRGEEGES
jgi:hypothetical protein